MGRGTLMVVGALWLGSGCVGLSRPSQATERNRIEQAEIAGTGANTAYDAVQQLRPDFLRGRTVPSGNSVRTATPVVFLDDTRLGDLEQLRTIPASMVMSIRLISASDATTRWGTGYPAGVIEVRSRT